MNDADERKTRSPIKSEIYSAAAMPPESLDLGFLELDVLADARVVLLEAQLLGLGAGFFLVT